MQITRVIRSLFLFGKKDLAECFLQFLDFNNYGKSEFPSEEIKNGYINSLGLWKLALEEGKNTEENKNKRPCHESQLGRELGTPFVAASAAQAAYSQQSSRIGN